MYSFPDTVSILQEVIEDHTSAKAVMWIPATLTGKVPLVHIYKVGGAQSGPLAQDRIAIDVYAEGRDTAYALADQIRQHLVGRFHYSEQYGQIDTVLLEVSPLDVPYLSDTVDLFSATYRVDTRAK